MTRKTRLVVPLLMSIGLSVTGCASRVSHQEIVRANGQTAVEGTSDGSMGSSIDPSPETSGPGGPQVGPSPGSVGGAGSGGSTTGGAGASSGSGGPTGTTGRGGLSPGASAAGAAITIGSVQSISGVGTAGVEQARQALQAWAADLNARGGLKGHPVRVIVKDDGGDASKARAQVQELVEKDKVVALVGNLGYSSSADAFQGYLEQKRVPAVGGNCAARGWYSSPVFFSQCSAPDTFLYGAVHLAAKYGTAKKFGSMVCVEDAICSTASNAWFDKGYAKKVGLDPVYRADISLAQPDFTAQCLQAQRAGVQILGLVVDPVTTKRIMSSCSQQGFKPQYLLTYAEETADTVKYAGDIISAQLLLPFAGIDTPAYRSFIAVWKKYNSATPTPMAMAGWTSAKVFERAATDAKTLTPAGLIEALYQYRNERFGGVTLPLSYGPRGTTAKPCVLYLRGLNGRWTAPVGDEPVCW